MMNVLIASDIHGSLRQGERLVQAFQREGAESLLLLGDILSGAANRESVIGLSQLLNSLAGRIAAVQGNGDNESHREWLDFPLDQERRIYPVQGKLIFATHGHIWRETDPPPLPGTGHILLTGHTHVPALRRHEAFTYLNPGAVSRPRGGSEAGYLLYQSGVFTWKTLDGVAYQQYAWPEGL